MFGLDRGCAPGRSTAGQILGLSRNTAYRLARLGQFPVPVLRAGAQYRVPVTGPLAALHIAAEAEGRTTCPPDPASVHVDPAPGVGLDSLRVSTSTSMTLVLQTGCAWDALLDSFPISRVTAHRQFSDWVDRGVMQALHQAVLAA